jgi:SAM-dependent methyltransferase
MDDAVERVLLHVGCGQESADNLPSFVRSGRWRVLRVDIDPDVAPDIVADIVDLAGIGDASADCIYAKHVIEHVETHQVRASLASFHRVLRPEGMAIIRTPDLEAASRLLVEHGPAHIAYVAEIGGERLAITPMDMLYGSRHFLARGQRHMAHRTGFTRASLERVLAGVGFERVVVETVPRNVELRCVALKRAEGNLFHRINGSEAVAT